MANSDLKTVGLSFKADGAVDFRKSLTDVNNAVNENRSAFKLAKSEWDSSTSSAEKLRATQEYLQNQTETYTQKVDRLTEILKAQESAEVRDEAAISKTRQQLDNAKASLNNYKSGLEDVNEKLKSGVATLEDYSKKVKDFSDSTGKIGNSLTKNVTAPITAAGAGVMAAWAQVDEGMDIIVQKTGATGDALEEMQNSARNIAKTIPTDFETAGIAVGEVNTRFHLTGEELENLSAKFIKFAELNGTDVNSSIDSTQKVIEAFNLSAEDAGALLDTMNKVGQDTGISMDTLASSMVSNAAALKELGMSAADAATFLGQCETSGVDTSAVMAGLKKALVNASKEGKSMKNALSELQDTMVNAGSSSEAYNAAVELFGAKAGPALAEFCQSGKLNFDELGASLNDNLGSVNDTFEATLDPADQFKLTLNQLKDAGFDVGNALGPVLAECLQMVTPILKDIIASWNSLSPGTQEMILKCLLLAAALGPVFSIINGTIICDTQEQLEGALKKKCEEQYAAGVDKPKITIKADMELLQNTELYEDVKELEAVSLGDTVHCKHSKLRIVSDARVIELEWDAVRNKLISVTLGKFQYNFLNNVSSIMNRVEQAIRSDGSLIGQQVQGTINGVKAQLRAQSSIAKKQTVRAVLFEDLDPDSPTFGAMCLGTLGFEIASERTADGRDWKWSTFGTGQGFFADFIVAGTMLADRIKGGTLELGGAGNGNGVAKVLNADGNEIVRLDKDGVYAKGKYVCANTDGSQTATLSNGKLTFKTESYEVVIRAGAIGGLTGLMIYPEQGAVRTKFLSISSNGFQGRKDKL